MEVRIRRTVAEKRRIVELTLQAGMSVARVAQAEGVNSHQVSSGVSVAAGVSGRADG